MAYNIPADGRKVNDVGWYLDNKGTLISPWESGTGGENANNPYSNITGFWGTSLIHGPEGQADHYINSITQMPYGTVGRFALGQRPDAYMGLARSPIIEQQLANIDTQSQRGYGGLLGRWQFGSTGNVPATAPVGWGRNPGTVPGAAAAAWMPTQYTGPNYAPGSGNGQNMGGGNGGTTPPVGGGGGWTPVPDQSQINPQNPVGPTPVQPTTGLLSKQNALVTNRIPRDNTQAAIDYTNQIMSAGTSQNRPAGTVNMGQILWAVNKAKKDGNYTNWYDAWKTYKDQYTPKPLSNGNNWINGVHR